MDNKRTNFNFSEPFLKAYILENVRDYGIVGRTIVLNLGKRSVAVAGKKLAPLSSSIYSNLAVEGAEKLACIELDEGLAQQGKFPFSGELVKKWQHVHDIFPLPHLKDTRLWRSKKESVGDIEFNLWFASKGTDCGLHNKHGFKEVHTQIYGLGRMQKFRENDFGSLYNEVFMAPGHTHEPFYDKNGAYPWHQYRADTDCIWLAVEFYSKLR